MNITGKQFDLQEAIKSRKQAILDAFGAGFIAMGNDGGGSYAMMDGKTSVHEAFVERDIAFIVDVFQRQLFPQLLAVNGIELTEDKMPKLKVGNISEYSWDELSKMVQRSASVNFLPKTVAITNEILDKFGIENLLPEEMTDEELQAQGTENRSRSGDGMTTAGEGTSTSVGGSDSSVSNNENGGS